MMATSLLLCTLQHVLEMTTIQLRAFLEAHHEQQATAGGFPGISVRNGRKKTRGKTPAPCTPNVLDVSTSMLHTILWRQESNSLRLSKTLAKYF